MIEKKIAFSHSIFFLQLILAFQWKCRRSKCLWSSINLSTNHPNFWTLQCMEMQTLKLCPQMVGGIFRKIIWRRGFSKKFIGKKILRSCGAGKSEYYTFCHFDHSFEELKYDTGIANLQGRELVTAAYDDPPHVYVSVDKTVNNFSAVSTKHGESKQLWKISINNYTGSPVLENPIVGTQLFVSCDAEMSGAERESRRMIQGRMHWAVAVRLYTKITLHEDNSTRKLDTERLYTRAALHRKQ